jgi:hypothetical protein
LKKKKENIRLRRAAVSLAPFPLSAQHLSVSVLDMPGGGGPISRRGAIASADGRLILAPAGASVRAYAAPSAAAEAGGGTASLVLVLSGHTDEVTAIARDPVNDEQVCGRMAGGRARRMGSVRWALRA